ncbi:MAG: DUF87 domain-containing protein [Candidatus Desulfaltia sp.]|nr:DUF87 domain-containing protein [Candidatus Desulfaltia sp.]
MTRSASARIVILDIHGEYANALRCRSTVFRVSANKGKSEKPLQVPFWALSFEELTKLAFGKLSDTQTSAVMDFIIELKKESLKKKPLDGIDANTLTVDAPVPFCIHKLWFELYKRDHHTLIPTPGAATDVVEPAYVLADNGNPMQIGDAMTVTPPLYRTVKTTGPSAERVQHGRDPLGIRQQLAGLASKLRDPRFEFIFNPVNGALILKAKSK